MKQLLLSLCILCCSANIFSQTLHGWSQDIDPESNLSFWNNEMQIVIFGDPPTTASTQFKMQLVDSIPYIEFSFSKEKQSELPKYLQGNNKWLVLFSDGFLFAYNADSEHPIKNGFLGPNGIRTQKYLYTSSSFLQENNLTYSASNLGSLKLKQPWVEGVPGYGVGECIQITPDNKDKYFNEILISIGFVSYEKPFLYEQNSRPKEIEITTENNDFNIKVELADTPNIQTIKLPKSVKDVKIIINKVYPGTKWDDTCINFIIPLSIL